MQHKSLHLKIPDERPFDKDNNWFESFIGNFVVPIIETSLIDRFWFSRYRDYKIGKHVRFRFYTNNYDKLIPTLHKLSKQFGLIDLNDENDYDPIQDLGSDRFLGNNKKHKDRFKRTNLVYDFLHATSKLFIDALSHSDEYGYFYREINNDKGNNPSGDSLESIHHLFCNITEVPLIALLIEKEQAQEVVSPLYKPYIYPDWKIKKATRIKF